MPSTFNSSDSTREGGNTKTPSPDKEIGKTKQESAKIKWCFTWNNYTEQNYSTIIKYFDIKAKKYIIGREGKDEGKTPHLQIYVEFKKKIRFTALKKEFPQIHIEECKGTLHQNIVYCTKEGDYKANFKLPRQLKWPSAWYPWQREVLKLIDTEPDDRTINWYWEKNGNTGKSMLVKYMCVEKGALLVPSKKHDAFHVIAKAFEAEKEIDIMVVDIPRDSLDYVSYTALEKIKDGQVISGKYEGCQCIFPSPHLIVFANEPPLEHKFSADRWNIVNIDLKQ